MKDKKPHGDCDSQSYEDKIDIRDSIPPFVRLAYDMTFRDGLIYEFVAEPEAVFKNYGIDAIEQREAFLRMRATPDRDFPEIQKLLREEVDGWADKIVNLPIYRQVRNFPSYQYPCPERALHGTTSQLWIQASKVLYFNLRELPDSNQKSLTVGGIIFPPRGKVVVKEVETSKTYEWTDITYPAGATQYYSWYELDPQKSTSEGKVCQFVPEVGKDYEISIYYDPERDAIVPDERLPSDSKIITYPMLDL